MEQIHLGAITVIVKCLVDQGQWSAAKELIEMTQCWPSEYTNMKEYPLKLNKF